MPHTIRNKFDKYLTYEKLKQAHDQSKKGKGLRKEIILFNLKQEEYLLWLLERLKTGTYKHGGYTQFYVTEPKRRKIEKSRYIDRIVHRWLVDNFLTPAFVPQFILTSYACLKGKGMHKSALYVQQSMREAKRKWGEYYILKMDVAKYFDNINKDILFTIIKRKIKDPKLIWLIQEILFSQKRKKGLEIGNYTSQMFANLYLNEVDQYIKHKLKAKYYCRYLDDSIIMVQSKQEAKKMLKQIQTFLADRLELELNQKTQIIKSKQGVNFCGYKINEYRMKIRDKGKRKLKKKIKHLKQEIKKENMTSKEAKKYLAGHLGYLKLADVYNLTSKLFYIDEK
jgi:retron-type reverse transcriptase